MKFSISFLATQKTQLPSPGHYKNHAIEAILFNSSDLSSHIWEKAWKLIEIAAQSYGAENVSFHFPVNDADFTTNHFVRQRLQEGLQRASDLQLHGMVVHSNKIKLIKEWEGLNLQEERQKVIEVLHEIREKVSGSTWLGLENMPVMDNFWKEIDPLFVYPQDFIELNKTKVKVVWDICHYTNTLSNIKMVIQKKQNQKYYPNYQETTLFDFLTIHHQIVHWHFSAFLGIANPDTGETCLEGVIPAKSTLGSSVYAKVIDSILDIADKNQHMVFEIKEEKYEDRVETTKMLSWAHLQMEKNNAHILRLNPF